MTFLEEEKVSMEVELEDILKKLANANNELEAMNVKVNGLENELQQEKMKRQTKYLDGKVSPEKKIEKKSKNCFCGYYFNATFIGILTIVISTAASRRKTS